MPPHVSNDHQKRGLFDGVLGFFLIFLLWAYNLIKQPILSIKRWSPHGKDSNKKIKPSTFWGKIAITDWGFDIREGDIDDLHDFDLYFEFTNPLSVTEQEELTKICKDWFVKGSTESNQQGSEFGGFIYYIADKLIFRDTYCYLGLELGSVHVEHALSDLFQKLSHWNNGRIRSITLGFDEKIDAIVSPNTSSQVLKQ